MSPRPQNSSQFKHKPLKTASERNILEGPTTGKFRPPVTNDNSGRISRLLSAPVLGISAWQLGLLVLITLLAFWLYLATTSRTLPTGDSGDLISAAWNLGVSHPPGYPLITMLGHLMGLLPWGTPAFRINLLSAVLDSLTIAVIGYGLLRLLAANFLKMGKNTGQICLIACMVAGVGLLAVSNTFWSYSIVAEVFALNNLFAAVIIVLMLEWTQKPRKHWFLWLSSLFAGLALTNQLTIALLAPGLFVLLFWGIVRWRKQARAPVPNRPYRSASRDPGYPVRAIAISVLFFIIGLLPYIYLPLASSSNPPVNWGNPSNFINFWHVVMRKDYGTFSFGSSLATSTSAQQVSFFARHFITNFTWVGIILAALGAVWFYQKRQVELLGLSLAFLIGGPLFMILANPPLNPPVFQGVFARFYIMPGIPFVFFIAAGVAWLLELVKKLAGHNINALLPRGLVTLCLVASILGPLGLAFNRLPALDLKNVSVAEDFGRDLLATLEPNAILVMNGDEFGMSVRYQQTVLGFRKDVTALDFPLLATPWYVEQQHRLHPEVTIPANMPELSFLAEFITANMQRHAVYAAGLEPHYEALKKSFDEVYSGLTLRFLKKGDGPDMYALLRSESDSFASLHFPDKAYPDTSWEADIAVFYANLALEIGWSRDKNGAQPDADFVEKMYRIAIFNCPTNYDACWNLAVMLWHNGRSPAEVQALVEKYLQLAPEGTPKQAARTFLTTLQNGK